MRMATGGTATHPVFGRIRRALRLRYEPEFVSVAEEEQLVQRVAALALVLFRFGAYQGKRRVVSFRSRYDFVHHRLLAVDLIPDWLIPLDRRVGDYAGLGTGAVGQILVTEYQPGAGIGWHRDKPQFGEIFGLSLAASCSLRFRRASASGWLRFALWAERCSLYAMTGEARHLGEHSIAPVSALRFSITFRTLQPDKADKNAIGGNSPSDLG